MKAKEKLLLTLLFVFGLFINETDAQFFRDVSLGINAGAFIYQGDLSPSYFGSLKTPRFGLDVYAEKPISDYVAFRLNLAIASLKGDESKYDYPAYHRLRDFKFSTPVDEISGLAVWNIRGNNYHSYGWTPYLLAGIGVSRLHVSTNLKSRDTSSIEFETNFPGTAADIAHGTPELIPVIPLGAGFEIPVSKKLSLTAESIYRITFTDYLDGVSLAANPKSNDRYYSVTFGIKYKLEKRGNEGSVQCPKKVL